jgi:hypothetical protein
VDIGVIDLGHCEFVSSCKLLTQSRDPSSMALKIGDGRSIEVRRVVAQLPPSTGTAP